mgnify:CR=1 FL=1
MDNDHKMTPKEWEMFNHQKKLDKIIEQNRYKCTCGHSVVIKPSEERILCHYCGHWIYRDKSKMFKDRMNILLKRKSEE